MTVQPDGASRVPDLVVERWRLGEMPADEKAAFAERLRTDDELRRRLIELDESDEKIRLDHPPAVLAAAIRERLDARAADRRLSSAWKPAWRWSAAAGVAVLLLVAVVLVPQLLQPGINSEADRIKGPGPRLVVFRKAPVGTELLKDGSRVRQGDLIRIGYNAAGAAYGVILSIDGRGVVTLHLPHDVGPSVRLASGGQVLLDSSYELDDAPRWERFYLVTSAEPFDAGAVVETARRVGAAAMAGSSAALPLDSRLSQSSLLLVKEPTP